MNGYERTKAALAGEQPDRTPVMLHNFMMAAREAGYSMRQYREDPKVIADSFARAIETYGYDGILVDIDTATLAGAVGVPVEFPEDEPALSHGGCLASLDDVEGLAPADVGQYKYVQIWLEAVALLKERFGGQIFIRGNCDQAPFGLACMMRTPQTWMMDLVMDEEKAVRLLDYCTDATCQFIRLMAQTGADMVSNGDSSAGPEMISPDMYAKFALPYEKQVVDAAHECGLPYALHICGNTEKILELMSQSGTDAVELDYKTDIRKAHDLYKDSITFIGNIDPSGVIARGSVDDVKRETEKLLDLFADTPRFIFNAGCAIPPTTPSENIKAMMDVVGG